MNMKLKSPISVVEIQFYTYATEQADDLKSISQFPFDKRSDFIADTPLGGIAVKIGVTNLRNDSGVRRNVALTLVDVTARCEVSSQNLKVNLRIQDYLKEYYASFRAVDIKAGHTYKLVVSDSITSAPLSERVFRLIDPVKFQHPTEWYRVCDGGLRPGWESNLYKTIRTEYAHPYYVRFNIEYKLGYIFSTIKPELELRLHFPDGKETEVEFCEPKCLGKDDYEDNLWYVEFPFSTSYERSGVFYAELLCMEYPIAGFAFDTDVDDERGTWFGQDIKPLDEYSLDAASMRWASSAPRAEDCPMSETVDFDKLLDDFISVQNEKSESESHLDDESEETEETEDTESDVQTASGHDNSLLPSLDHLTGLRSVKEKLGVYESVVRFNKMRSEKGFPTPPTPLHAMFLGSPGTGKTTVAKMIGVMLRRAGVLSKGHIVVRERSTLLGQNYNSESEKTLAAIEEAQGGILFIDEAYQLYQPSDARDPGKFVIETLLTALADESNRDWMLILAGYPDMMKRMFEMNPGFKSRIPDSNIYVFDDFTESELMEIAENYLARNDYTLSAQARQALTERLNADYVHRDESFGNARHVINMIQTEILPSMAVRVINEGLDDENSLTVIREADIPAPVTKSAPFRSRIGFAI